jgi:hypothetical protein
MIAINTLLRGASLAGLFLAVGVLGGWGRAATLPVPASVQAKDFGAAHIVSGPYQVGAARVILARTKEDTGENGLAVNAYLWRAALDTLSFMPLAEAQPAGGVIITDWYANPSAPDERFKMTVYITDKRLRSDGVRVALFRQVRNKSQNWQDATTDPETATRLENAILARARQYKLAASN